MAETRTEAEGRFRLARLPAGEALLSIRAGGGLELTRRPVAIVAGREVGLTDLLIEPRR